MPRKKEKAAPPPAAKAAPPASPARGGPRENPSDNPRDVSRLRGKLWVDVGRRTGLTEAGADLLEQIDACGSLSAAARRLRFAYRRAWMLVDAMNAAWPGPLVTTAVGGKQGGGAKLTERGRHVLATYRDLQVQLEHFIGTAGDPFDLE